MLTNASALMALGTSNRFARVIDRGRSLAHSIKALAKDDQDRGTYLRMLERNEQRGAMLVKALRGFYFAIGCFAASSLLSLLGVCGASLNLPGLLNGTLWIAFVAGTSAVGGLLHGCVLLVRETALALINLREESDCIRRQAIV